MTLAPVDLCFLAVIITFAVSAFIKGLVNELFGKLIVIGSFASAIIFTPLLNRRLVPTVTNPTVSKVFAFIIIFIVAFLSISIVEQLVARLFSGRIMRGLDRWLGFLLGGAEGLAVIAALLIILTAQPWYDVSPLFDESVFYKMLSAHIRTSALYLRGLLPNV